MSAPWDPPQRIDQWDTWLRDRGIAGERSTDPDTEIATISFKGMFGNSTIAVDVTFDRDSGVADFIAFIWDNGTNETCDLAVKDHREQAEKIFRNFLAATD